MFNFKHLKLKVYRFLAKFIPYFKRKYQDMSINAIKQDISTVLHNCNFSNIRFGENMNYGTKSYELLVDTVLDGTINIQIRFRYNLNDGLSIRYNYDDFEDEKSEQDFKNFKVDIRVLKKDLEYSFSVLN